MIYEFKSKSEASVVFTGPGGDWLLALIGRAPAPSGIIEPEAMPAAIEAIETAIAHEEARRIRPPLVALVQGDSLLDEDVRLRQRAWPFVKLLKRTHEGGEAIVWGA